MKRDYKTGVQENVIYFVGDEIEKTPAYGLRTLFVTGLQPTYNIEQQIASENKKNVIKHIFFGANHSFDPKLPDDWHDWEVMISHFLKLGYTCSLDIPLSAVEEFNDGCLCSYNNFIPQIRIPIPYLSLWNYNTMLKIDDKGFKATNPGVWTHSMHSLTDRNAFTSWSEYGNDEVIG